jgi:hypothetical protein
MNTSSIILFGLFVLAIIIVSPFITIWALNTVFPSLAIPLTIWTYLAVIWLHTVAVGITYKSSK